VFGNLWNLKYISYPMAESWKKHKRNTALYGHNIFMAGKGERERERRGQGIEPAHITSQLTVIGILVNEN
jgi:hypothetical protein